MKILQTFDNLDYELTEEQAESIMQASTLGKQNGIWIGGDYIAFASIKNIVDLPETKNNYPQLPPGLGFEGIIKKSPNRGLEMMAKGLKGFIESQKKMGIATPKADELLKKMREQYALKNTNKVLA